MRPVSLDRFWSDPIGRCLSRPGFLYGCVDRRLFFTLVGAVLTPEDAAAALQVYRGELDNPRTPHASLFDATQLVSLDSETFDLLRRYTGDNSARLGQMVLRQAVVHSTTQVGATVAGYYAVFQPVFEIRLFTARADALSWLERPDAAPVIDAAEAAWLAETQTLASLRGLLNADLRTSLEAAAHRLGVSARALQRQLRDATTSFRQERCAAQVRRAQELLLAPERKLVDIALEVGCASHQVFSEMFRRATGVTPTEWRARHLDAEKRSL